MLVAAATAAGAQVGGGNAVVEAAGAGVVGKGVTNVAMAAATATVVEGMGASIVPAAGAVVVITTITTVEIVVTASLTLVTTPLPSFYHR